MALGWSWYTWNLAELAELEDEMMATICRSLCSWPSLALQANPVNAMSGAVHFSRG